MYDGGGNESDSDLTFGLLDVLVFKTHLIQVDVDDSHRLVRAPSATREIGDVVRTRAAIRRLLGEFAETARNRKVVHVHVERETLLEAVHPTCIHDEVHAAMAANALCELSDCLPKRMLVLGADLLRLVLRIPLMGSGTRLVLEHHPVRKSLTKLLNN